MLFFPSQPLTHPLSLRDIPLSIYREGKRPANSFIINELLRGVSFGRMVRFMVIFGNITLFLLFQTIKIINSKVFTVINTPFEKKLTLLLYNQLYY